MASSNAFKKPNRRFVISPYIATEAMNAVRDALPSISLKQMAPTLIRGKFFRKGQRSKLGLQSTVPKIFHRQLPPLSIAYGDPTVQLPSLLHQIAMVPVDPRGKYNQGTTPTFPVPPHEASCQMGRNVLKGKNTQWRTSTRGPSNVNPN